MFVEADDIVKRIAEGEDHYRWTLKPRRTIFCFREQLLTELPLLNCCRGKKQVESTSANFVPYHPALLGRPVMLWRLLSALDWITLATSSAAYILDLVSNWTFLALHLSAVFSVHRGCMLTLKLDIYLVIDSGCKTHRRSMSSGSSERYLWKRPSVNVSSPPPFFALAVSYLQSRLLPPPTEVSPVSSVIQHEQSTCAIACQCTTLDQLCSHCHE